MNGDIKLFDDSGNKRKSRKTSDIISTLEERGYDKEIKKVSINDDVDNEDDDEKESKNSGYDYLMRLQFRSITEEKINKLSNDIASKIKERDTMTKTYEKKLWHNELKEFEVEYHKWLKDIENETVKTKKSKWIIQKLYCNY